MTKKEMYQPTERANVVFAMMDVASSLMPILFDNNKMKVLLCLACWCENKHVMNYSSIARVTKISEGAVLNHCLRLLEEDGIIYNEKNGKYSYYGLTPLGAAMTNFFIEVIETLQEARIYERVFKKELEKRRIALKEVNSSLQEIKKSLSSMGVSTEEIYLTKARPRRGVAT